MFKHQIKYQVIFADKIARIPRFSSSVYGDNLSCECAVAIGSLANILILMPHSCHERRNSSRI